MAASDRSVENRGAGIAARAVAKVRDARLILRFAVASQKRPARECNLCGYYGQFSPFGSPPRFDAKCRGCGSLERHRELVLYVDKYHPIHRSTSVLHFAPEEHLVGSLKGLANRYVTADIIEGMGDVVLNVEQLELADCSFDVIMFSHVLEHVDDAKTLRELYRVLTPGGTMLAMFPVIEGWDTTYENASVKSDHDRVLHFGQRDHVRYFGRDVRERIQAVGFELREFAPSPDECLRYSLERGERVFIATKPI